jgi:hypothetical protein
MKYTRTEIDAEGVCLRACSLEDYNCYQFLVATVQCLLLSLIKRNKNKFTSD